MPSWVLQLFIGKQLYSGGEQALRGGREQVQLIKLQGAEWDASVQDVRLLADSDLKIHCGFLSPARGAC